MIPQPRRYSFTNNTITTPWIIFGNLGYLAKYDLYHFDACISSRIKCKANNLHVSVAVHIRYDIVCSPLFCKIMYNRLILKPILASRVKYHNEAPLWDIQSFIVPNCWHLSRVLWIWFPWAMIWVPVAPHHLPRTLELEFVDRTITWIKQKNIVMTKSN